MKVVWSEKYNHPLPPGHRFPMIKYDLVPQQLIREGVISEDDLETPEPIDENDILLVHTKPYWEKLQNLSLSPLEIRQIGLPFSESLVARERLIAGGTVKAALLALENEIAFNAAGGTHHAYSDKGEGFCLLNDQAIAAKYLLINNFVEKVLIVDLDVHQGNGTARIFQTDERVLTFSMHGKNNIYSSKESSGLDIELPDGTIDSEYLNILETNLKFLVDSFLPGFIFFQAGVDVLETDRLGKLSLSDNGCKERDKTVFRICKQLNIPVAVTMGGGYSPKLTDIVEAHCNTFKAAVEIFY